VRVSSVESAEKVLEFIENSGCMLYEAIEGSKITTPTFYNVLNERQDLLKRYEAVKNKQSRRILNRVDEFLIKTMDRLKLDARDRLAAAKLILQRHGGLAPAPPPSIAMPLTLDQLKIEINIINTALSGADTATEKALQSLNDKNIINLDE